MELIHNLKFNINYQIDNIPIDNIRELSNVIINSEGNIFLTGIGKCETIAIHITNLLKSIGIKCFFLNTQNSTHGDIGCIDKKDIVLLFSKSGNTIELLNLISVIELKKCQILGITCSDNSKMNEICKCINLPFKQELFIDNNINLIPTNSCINFLLFGNILVSLINNKNKLEYNEYQNNHPGGNIGYNLKKVDTIINKSFPKIILNKNIKIIDILMEMTKYSIGVCMFTNNDNELIGILLDGDIRRILVNNPNLIFIEENMINKNFKLLDNISISIIELKKKFNYKSLKFLPVIIDNKIYGVINLGKL